jgi:serine protease Do
MSRSSRSAVGVRAWRAALTCAVALGPTAVVVRAAPATRPATHPAGRPADVNPATTPVKPATAPATRPAGPAPKPLTLAPLARPIPSVPTSVADLRAIEQRVEQLTAKVLPAVVGVSVDGGQGSGVIVSSDGYVLTAAHVSGTPDQDIRLTLSDGREVKAKTLGANKGADAGMAKITEPGVWPYCELGKSADLKPGQWVVALGHPGGYRKDRPPVLRLGRVLNNPGVDKFLSTDCTLVGGDSGGPLYDLDGKVVGIHSRIGPSTQNNMHTPVDAFSQTWDRLAKGDEWGGGPLESFFAGRPGPMMGIIGETVGGDEAEGGKGARIKSLIDKTPATDAGMQPGDVIVQFDKKPVRTIDDLSGLIAKKKAGDEVAVVLTRDGKRVEMKVKLVRRPRD